MNNNKPHKNSKKEPRNILYGLVIVVVSLLLLSLLFGINYRYKYMRVSNYKYPLSVWKTGDIIDDQKLAFSVNPGIKEDKQGFPGLWTPGQGKKFIILSVSLKNKTGGLYQLSPVTSMKLKDKSNNSYEPTSAPLIKNGLGGPVKDNTTAYGEVGFIVPEQAEDLKLFFDPRIPDEQTIIVSIK